MKVSSKKIHINVSMKPGEMCLHTAVVIFVIIMVIFIVFILVITIVRLPVIWWLIAEVYSGSIGTWTTVNCSHGMMMSRVIKADAVWVRNIVIGFHFRGLQGSVFFTSKLIIEALKEYNCQCILIGDWCQVDTPQSPVGRVKWLLFSVGWLVFVPELVISS